ncbi:MBL fold metallo-hydrolase [Viridibacillus sp. FSL H7-0596]|uniref:ComEC/Rec2 family competence protein n=1 Tax=Viridibacillus sp. FSL H7-0596 TaxID=1928923 RepID=UPI00096ED57E|nr:MBL fold metallo-hydrolase [Viridibacillus sp. FSL H7-0596]OMC86543.1 MBL fold metallo-hydrolase [Viridibacillus sp. FSL H7-0596]
MKKTSIFIVLLIAIGLIFELTDSNDSNKSTDQTFTGKASDVLVHIIDIGQGDSILIQSKKENILIDAGNKGAGDEVVAYLQKNNVTTLDAVVSTHPDADHVGGLAEVINSIEVKKVYAPKVSHTTIAYKNFLTAVKNQGLKITQAKTGVEIPTTEENLSLKFIAPVTTYSQSDLNDWSAVLLLQNGNNKFLFTGDAEFPAEDDMLAKNLIPQVDVLKVSHHGAEEATSDAFLAKAKPTYAAISVSATNGYGHPTAVTLNRLKKVGAKVYRTDKQGNIVFKSTGSEISVKENQ